VPRLGHLALEIEIDDREIGIVLGRWALHICRYGYRAGDNHTHLVEQEFQCIGDLPAILDDEHA
jgi:hypothetical protein